MMCSEDYLASIMELLTKVTIQAIFVETASALEVNDDV
jgi:hypothetical protein